MKLVYTHENKILVENAKNLLAHNGMEAFVKNEYLSSGMGELSSITTWPELWVLNDEDYTAAKALISELSANNDREEWQCQKCQELNDASFELCWNCGAERS